MLRVMLVVFFFGAAAFAAVPTKLDQLKVGSLTYSNITIVNVTATDLYFSYDKGIKNVKLRQLDSETQKLFNYDPKAAEALEKQQEEGAARFQTTLAAPAGSGASTAVAAPQEPEKRKKTAEENLVDPISERSLIGKSAPSLNIEKWMGSAPAPVLKGKFVLIGFLAPWSIPSQKWVTQLNMIQKKFGGKLETVALFPEADAEDRSLDSKLEIPFAADEKNRLASGLGVENVPCVVFIDPTGVILYQGHPAALGDREIRLLMAKSAAAENK